MLACITRPSLQICFHDHCFDGVASAATFLRFYRERISPLAEGELALRGLAHKAGQFFGEEVYQVRDSCIVDFRFSADARLTDPALVRWIDLIGSPCVPEAEQRPCRRLWLGRQSQGGPERGRCDIRW